MTASASLSWSTAVLTVPLSRPLGSVYVVFFMPSDLAASFIFRTNAVSSSDPVSHRASSRATLLPDGIISIFSMSCRLYFCPTRSPTMRDSSLAVPSSTVLASTVTVGPGSSRLIGCSRRITYAVMILATLAVGTGFCSPNVPMVPEPATMTAACPFSGHGMLNVPPPTVNDAAFVSTTRLGSGNGRTTWTTSATSASSATRGDQILTRRRAVRAGVFGGGGVLVSCASRSMGEAGGVRGCTGGRSATPSVIVLSDPATSFGGRNATVRVLSEDSAGVASPGSSSGAESVLLASAGRSVSLSGSVPSPSEVAPALSPGSASAVSAAGSVSSPDFMSSWAAARASLSVAVVPFSAAGSVSSSDFVSSWAAARASLSTAVPSSPAVGAVSLLGSLPSSSAVASTPLPGAVFSSPAVGSAVSSEAVAPLRAAASVSASGGVVSSSVVASVTSVPWRGSAPEWSAWSASSTSSAFEDSSTASVGR